LINCQKTLTIKIIFNY